MAHDRLTAVVAMTPDGVIGLDGDMPWRLRSDLRRFKRLTMGGVLIMGRRTFDSIGRPLPGRRTIVVTSNPSWHSEGAERASSPQQAVAAAKGAAETTATSPPGDHQPSGIFVVGGAEIYRQLLPSCHDLFLTRVWSQVLGDTKLEIDLSQFRVIEQTRLPASGNDDVPTEFLRLIRRKS